MVFKRLEASWRAAICLILLVSSASPARSDNVAEVDILFPRPGDTFSLNQNGMSVVLAVQNVEEAWRYTWDVVWGLRSTFNKTGTDFAAWDTGGGIGNYSTGDAKGAWASPPVTLQPAGPYIGMSHSYWPTPHVAQNATNKTLPEPGVYVFDWRFDIGPWCAFYPGNATRSSSSEWGSGHTVSKGKFNVTIVADAPLPTITTDKCGYFAGAVSYASTTTWIGDWQTLHDNFICVETASVTQSAPCSATIGAQLAQNVSDIMGWTSAAATGTKSSGAQGTSSTTATDPPASSSTTGSGAIRPHSGWNILFSLVPLGILVL